MKLAILCRYFPQDAIGGGENYIYEIWNRARLDYQTELISGWKRDPKLLPYGTYPIDLRGSSTLSNYYNFYKESKQYLKEIEPDLIQSTCYEFSSLKIPTVITVCHLGHHMGKVGMRAKRMMQKQMTIKSFNKDSNTPVSLTRKSDGMSL